MWGGKFHPKNAWRYTQCIFLNNLEQYYLIKLIGSYSQTDECRNLFQISLFINSGENIWSTIKETIGILTKLDHDKHDTKFHAEIINKSVIAAKDKKVFLLLFHALGQLEYLLSPHLQGI